MSYPAVTLHRMNSRERDATFGRLPSGLRRRAPRFSPATIRRHPLLLMAAVGSLAGRAAEETIALVGMDSREFVVLDLLVGADAPLAQATIAFQLSRDRTTVMQLVRSLARKGFVTLWKDPDDGRVRAVMLTAGGLERYRLAESNLEAAAEDFFWLHSETERQGLVAAGKGGMQRLCYVRFLGRGIWEPPL